jgi:ribose transport system substrate-binding protein
VGHFVKLSCDHSKIREEAKMGDSMNKGRRDFLTAASGGGLLAALGTFGPGAAQAQNAISRSEKPLRAAFSNGGLQSSWCAQGKAAAEYWGKLFNVEVTWFDGELDAVKQRAAINAMASQAWDFVAIQANDSDTLNEPVQKMIDAGIPVITMDTHIASGTDVGIYSHLGADNEGMGEAITQALVAKLGGKGKVIMTQGPLDHTGAQGRTRGFESVIKNYPDIEVLDTQPGDWDVAKVAKLWEGLLAKYPLIDAAFFHSDDMALAAYEVMKAHGRTSTLIAGIDAMPPAIDAVFEGRMFATVRNPSCLIHGGAIMVGVAAATAAGDGSGGTPANIVTDGPVVTLEKADGMRWLQDQFLL